MYGSLSLESFWELLVFRFGAACVSAICLQLLSFHHSCTATLAFHSVSGAPSTVMQIRWSRWCSLRQNLLSVLINFRLENSCSTCPFAIGRQNSNSTRDRMFVHFFESTELKRFHQIVWLSSWTRLRYHLAYSAMSSYSSLSRVMSTRAFWNGTSNRALGFWKAVFTKLTQEKGPMFTD